MRIFGVPTKDGLPNTRAGAEEAERRAIARVYNTGEVKKPSLLTKEPEVPKVREFASVFIDASRIQNKRSSVESKEAMLRTHIVPRLGDLRLDQVTYAIIEDFKLALSRTPIANAERRSDAAASARLLSPKSINNVLTCLSHTGRSRTRRRRCFTTFGVTYFRRATCPALANAAASSSTIRTGANFLLDGVSGHCHHAARSAQPLFLSSGPLPNN